MEETSLLYYNERMKQRCRILSLFFAFALCVVAFSAHAETPVSKETANTYFGNCMAKRDPRMTTKSQEELCACTAAKMTEVMTMEDIKRMGQQTQEGIQSFNLMMTHVYMPCIGAPVHDLLMTECLADKKIDEQQFKIDKGDLCGCIAGKTGKWMADQGPAMMEIILKKNPHITDPIQPIMDSPDFRREQMDNLLRCVMKKDK